MLLSVTIFAVIMLVALVAGMVMNSRQQRRARLMSVIARSRDDLRGDEASNKALAKARADIAKKLKETSDEHNEKRKDRTSIRELMQQAGIEAPLSKYWMCAAGFAVVVYLLLLLTSWPMIAKIFFTFTAFMGMPKLFLKIKAGRRQKKFLKEFADALDAMARLLQAGMPMSEAIAMTSREFEGPLKEEMLRIYDNQKIGVPMGEAAQMTARRVPLPEVHMFATAIQIQSETGSSLSEVLSNLSAVIRSRFRLRRKVQALSSEAKSSAAIIGALPLLVMFALWCVRPEYIGQLFHKTTGKYMLYGCAAWMSLGILMMRQMINFRI